MNKNIKLSVCVVCYNQEEYIAQCLQSLVDQETDFDFEVIVSDDCSTDKTREIIKEFAKSYPNIIKAILHKNNMGPYENYLITHKEAIGEYIAHMDGDDYALPGKFQNQVNFLDENPGCNIVWHPMNKLSEDGSIKKPSLSSMKKILDKRFFRKDIIELMAIGIHSSKMYRKTCREFIVPSNKFIDYYINVEQVGSGYAAYSSINSFGVYRTGIGIASSGHRTKRILCESFIIFSKKYPQYRMNVNTAALSCFLVEVKNIRPTSIIYLKAFIKTYHFSSVFNLLKTYKYIKLLNY